ncbi:hypothetical protein MUP65_00500, partial [Patescibacteria group bacterium]|nr:hypothetical protein [Patescibacteria group bacterium]
DITGEHLVDPATNLIYQLAALGADSCPAFLEGQTYQGFFPGKPHEVWYFVSATERATIYQASQWITGWQTPPEGMSENLAIGKAENFRVSGLDPEEVAAWPVKFHFIDPVENRMVVLETTLGEVETGSFLLPQGIRPIPAALLPHFAGVVAQSSTEASEADQPATGSFTGTSQYDAPNVGLVCSTKSGTLGVGETAFGRIDEAWDSQCLYLLDGKIDGQRAVGLIRGADIVAAASTFDASVWPVPAAWVGLDWAEEFGWANCPDPKEMPIVAFQASAWTELETYICP